IVYSVILFILSLPVYFSWIHAKGDIIRFIRNNISFTGYAAFASFAWTIYLMLTNDTKGMTEMIELFWWAWVITLTTKFYYLHKDIAQLEG
ncbi:MAG: hypothetical protein KAG45_06060, partial [Methyloprofundus sp.]|nr:hypothetical protein [Methyloprofundus sp.]